jgi:Collagen triple helix repeat (20 copies)
MMAERLRIARRNAIPAGLLLILVGVLVGIGLEVASIRQQLSTAKHNSAVLAQQVRDLGGVPKVSPQPGPPGVSGSPGSAGQPGQNGRNGSNGSPGTAGATGKQGSTGVKGPPGPAGATGVEGPPGPSGPAGPVGPAGKDGKDGADGKDGSAPTGWTFTYLGVTYACTPDSAGATTYSCAPQGTTTQTSARRRR